MLREWDRLDWSYPLWSYKISLPATRGPKYWLLWRWMVVNDAETPDSAAGRCLSRWCSRRCESPCWTHWAQTREFSAWANIQEETPAESTLGVSVMTCVRAQCCEKERKKTNKPKSADTFARCFSADHLLRVDSAAASWKENESLSNQTRWKIYLHGGSCC